MTARLCFQNLLDNGTVVASSENASYPVANAYDGVTADYFRPALGGTITIDLTLGSPASANYFSFFNQDLFSLSGTIKLAWWNGSTYVDCFSAVSPADNSPRTVFFASQTSTKWRVTISCASVFNLGMISFGAYLELPHGMYLNWVEPQLAKVDRLINSVSDGGQFLGRSIISKGVQTTVELQYAADGWVRSNWPAFVTHAQKKPWWFAHNIESYPNESAVLFLDGNMPPPRHLQYGFMGASIPVRGLIE